MVVIAPVIGGVGVRGGRVGRADVRSLAPVVPGDDLDEVGLQLEQVQPFVDPDPVVLVLAPVHVGVEALEEPGRDGGDPFLVRCGTVGCELGVDVGFLGCGEVWVDPGEEAVGVSAASAVGRFGGRGHGTGDEKWGRRKVGEDVGVPVPGRIGVLEGAEHGLSVDHKLGGVGGEGVVQVDDQAAGGDAGEIDADEDFEVQGRGLGVEFGEVARKLVEVGVPAAIVECECVDAGPFSKLDVIGIIAVRGHSDKHVMSENKRPGRASLG